MATEKLLRKQVESEKKLRRYVVYTVLLLVLASLCATIVFSDSGLMRYVKLGEKEAELSQELKRIETENLKLQEAIEAYRQNDFYVEKHARENFGLSGPGEYIFRYEKQNTTPKAP